MWNWLSANSFSALLALLALLAASSIGAMDEPIASDGGLLDGEPPVDHLLIATDSPGTLKIKGFSEGTFAARTGQMICMVSGAAVSQDISDVQVRINDIPVDIDLMRIARNGITVDYELDDGLNEIVVTALDTDGQLLRADLLVWAGNNELDVYVVNENQEPIDGAKILLKLSEDEFVTASAISQAGNARFENLPAKPVRVLAVDRQGRAARTVAGNAGSVVLELSGKHEPGQP